MKVPAQLAEAIATATRNFIASERNSQAGKINLIGLVCLTLYLIIFLIVIAVPAWLQLVKTILGKPPTIEILATGAFSVLTLIATTIVCGLIAKRTEPPPE